MKICISMLLAVAILTSLTGLMTACSKEPTLATPSPSPASLTILHTNDVRSHLDNIAHRATKVSQVRNEVGADNLLLVDAGDVFSGTPYFTLYQGQAGLWFMNYMDYDAMCTGNHEFDKGPDVLASFVNSADFPVLCANFDFSNESSLAKEIAPWTIIEKGGERYGVFGLTTEDTRTLSLPGPDIIINNHISAAKKAVSDLTGEGIDKIIALTHIGWENDLKLAQEVEGIDIIIGGHTRTVPDIYPTVVTNDSTPTLIVQAGENGEYLGQLDVSFNENGVVQSWEGQLISIDDNIEEDATCADKLAEYDGPIEELMSTVIGETTVDLDGERGNVRVRETNLGNLIADAILDKAEYADATIAIQNSGSIRASIPAGYITLGQAMTVLPFRNYLMVVDLTGEQVITALENGISQVEQEEGRFPQVAGLRFTWNPSAESGSRIVSVEVSTREGYQQIKTSASYQVVINDFVYQGGDGYTIVQEGTNATSLDFTDYEALVEYIKANSPLSNETEGRIVQQ
ncbi:bifunctional metallophosphatase/5'-nucleotidase [Chloroflexota bacterium]